MLKVAEQLKLLNKRSGMLDVIVVLGMSKSTFANLNDLLDQAETVKVVDANEDVWGRSIEQKNKGKILFHNAVVSAVERDRTFYCFNLPSYDGFIDFSSFPSAPKNLIKVSEKVITPVLIGELLDQSASLQTHQKVGLIIDIGQEGESVFANLPEKLLPHLDWCLFSPSSFEHLDYSSLGLTIHSLAEEPLTAKKWFAYQAINPRSLNSSVDQNEREIELAFLRDENRLLEIQSRQDLENIRRLSDELASVEEVAAAYRAESAGLNDELLKLRSELSQAREELAKAQLVEDATSVVGVSDEIKGQVIKLNAQVDLIKELLFGRTEIM